MTKNLFGIVLFFLISCNRIETASSLSKSDIEYIRSLQLLDQDEPVCRFYSEFKIEKAGNFITNKRLATYWIDERHKEKSQISFAFYRDVKSIDTVFNPGASYSPYMLITKFDSTQFKVCVDGKREAVESFFEEAIRLWRQNKSKL